MNLWADRETAYRRAKVLIDDFVFVKGGATQLRQERAIARRVLRKKKEYSVDDLIYAEWLDRRIAAALARRQLERIGMRASKVPKKRTRSAALEICGLLGVIVWDEHKLTARGRDAAVREALGLAQDIAEGRTE